MKLAFLTVSALGVAIGLALAKPPAPAAAPLPVATRPAPKPTETILTREESGHFLTVADVNDEPIRFVVDTGADIVALTQEDARRAHVDFDPARFTEVGRGAGGPVRGQEVIVHDLALDGKRASEVRAVVLENVPMSLLGQTYLRRLDRVSIEGDRMTLK